MTAVPPLARDGLAALRKTQTILTGMNRTSARITEGRSFSEAKIAPWELLKADAGRAIEHLNGVLDMPGPTGARDAARRALDHLHHYDVGMSELGLQFGTRISSRQAERVRYLESEHLAPLRREGGWIHEARVLGREPLADHRPEIGRTAWRTAADPAHIAARELEARALASLSSRDVSRAASSLNTASDQFEESLAAARSVVEGRNLSGDELAIQLSRVTGNFGAARSNLERHIDIGTELPLGGAATRTSYFDEGPQTVEMPKHWYMLTNDLGGLSSYVETAAIISRVLPETSLETPISSIARGVLDEHAGLTVRDVLRKAIPDLDELARNARATADRLGAEADEAGDATTDGLAGV